MRTIALALLYTLAACSAPTDDDATGDGGDSETTGYESDAASDDGGSSSGGQACPWDGNPHPKDIVECEISGGGCQWHGEVHVGACELEYLQWSGEQEPAYGCDFDPLATIPCCTYDQGEGPQVSQECLTDVLVRCLANETDWRRDVADTCDGPECESAWGDPVEGLASSRFGSDVAECFGDAGDAGVDTEPSWPNCAWLGLSDYIKARDASMSANPACG